jgi:hypothetical protein
MNPYLLPALETTPRLIRRAFEKLPPASWDRPTHPGRFTPRQVLAHLLDWEPILCERIRLAVETPGATLRTWDEGERAVTERYDEWDPIETLDRWFQERSRTIAYVETLDAEALLRTAIHPERGTLCAADLANMIPCHDLYHVEQLLDVADAQTG